MTNPRASAPEPEKRRLATAATALLLHQERRSLRALLRAERRTHSGARAAVEPLIERASASIAGAGPDDAQRVALATLRRTGPQVQRALEAALVEGRAQARAAGRETTGVLQAAAPLSGRDEHDATSAHSSALAWTAGWLAAASALVLEEGDLARAPVAAARARATQLARIAATETAGAFNDERRRIASDLARSSLAPEFVRIWSAVLDRRTCPFCFAKDGQVRGLHESFGARPPVHPNCRCIIELLRVPRPERLEDIGIDYAAFKAELRDVIRERREESGRRATAFFGESMAEKRRSPLVLTERFRAQPYVRR